MTRAVGTQGGLDDLGVLITAAWGLDREWLSDAACVDYEKPSQLSPSPWQFDRKQRFGDVTGVEMIKLALLHCFGCKAQYDCGTYAVGGSMRAGTWGMDIIDLRWLQTQDDRFDLLELARSLGEPTQRLIREARLDRTA